MNSILIMALPTLVLVLLKNKLISLDKINGLKRIMLFANTFNLVLLFFTPFDIDAWLTYLIFWALLIGVQKEVFIEAKDRFFDFMLENDGQFLFTPIKIDEKEVRGVITLPGNHNFAVSAKYLGDKKLEKNTKYKNIRVYIAINSSGNISKVFCVT